MINFIRSSVGKKYLMGISGLIWAGFIFTHMAGNMLILVSPDAYNMYGHSITSNKPLLYGVESLLILSLIVHVFSAISLTRSNNKAKQKSSLRPAGTSEKKAAFGSRTMIIQGSIVLVFIISHLITFKYGTYYETTINGVVVRDLAKLIQEVFSNPGAVAWYVVSLLLLGVHIRHGFGSMFQSFGLLHPGYTSLIKKASWAYAVVVAGGFLSQPIFVFLTR